MDSRYRIQQKSVGQGGFGVIDKAFDDALERTLAIKTLDPLFKKTPSAEDKERFRREAKVLASLTHPNIPAIYDVVIPADESEFKILFQWIDGITIREYLTTRGPLTLDQVRLWFGHICSALTHAHSKNIIHRDIKPSNLIVTHDLSSCYLVDFGIALRTSDIKRVTEGTPIGTPGYMSPEQERGDELTAASDLFSLGVVLYESLSGSKPTVGQYVPLNSINETIPSTIDELVRRCLLDARTRIQTAVEFSDQLKNALRPRASFSIVLSEGSLADVHLGLTQMSPEEYANLPKGQRTLIISRLKDLIRVNAPHMLNPIASLLSELCRLGHFSPKPDFPFIVEKAVEFGYETRYTTLWTGNISIRNTLNASALTCHSEPHRIITEKTLAHWTNIDTVTQKESWYHHDLRVLLQNLLANNQCPDDLSTTLAEKLDRLNELTHPAAAPA
ncbi:MAG: hypothetical protein HBSIN02_25040 [Bacteroidia bacterium]|nr:MAG: hypothetical protein HBSIN02_25040 [Bacteroidia bacterium]